MYVTTVSQYLELQIPFQKIWDFIPNIGLVEMNCLSKRVKKKKIPKQTNLSPSNYSNINALRYVWKKRKEDDVESLQGIIISI